MPFSSPTLQFLREGVDSLSQQVGISLAVVLHLEHRDDAFSTGDVLI